MLLDAIDILDDNRLMNLFLDMRPLHYAIKRALVRLRVRPSQQQFIIDLFIVTHLVEYRRPSRPLVRLFEKAHGKQSDHLRFSKRLIELHSEMIVKYGNRYRDYQCPIAELIMEIYEKRGDDILWRLIEHYTPN